MISVTERRPIIRTYQNNVYRHRGNTLVKPDILLSVFDIKVVSSCTTTNEKLGFYEKLSRLTNVVTVPEQESPCLLPPSTDI